MKIRLGSSPSIAGRVLNLSRGAPRVVQGRVVRKVPRPVAHLPPVHFFAEADVAAGAEATLRSEALSNRTGRPVEIHEIRLGAFITTSNVFVDLGGLLRLRLSTGEGNREKIVTNSFVPFWSLGKMEQQPNQVFAPETTSTSGATALYIWRLARPWYLPPDAKMIASLSHSGAIRSSVRGMIGLAGRYVSDRRPTSHVPYAASYVSKPFGYDDVDFDESSERDIANITGKTLNVDRIITRIGVARNLSVAGAPIVSFIDSSDAAQTRMMNLRILTSTNLPIIRDYSSPRAIFGYSRSLDVDHIMSPNDFYRVGVQKTAGEALGTAYVSWSAQAFVSILGSREEAI